MSRRGVYRGVYSVLQNDPDFRKLSPQARHTLLSMRLADYVGVLCFWQYNVAVISAQTGYPVAQLEAIFGELEKHRWIRRSDGFMWIRNGLKHDPTAILQNANHVKHVLTAVQGLPRISLTKKFCRHYHLAYPYANGIPHAIPHAIPNGIRMPLPIQSPNPNPNPNPSPNPRTRTKKISSKGIEPPAGLKPPASDPDALWRKLRAQVVTPTEPKPEPSA